MEWVLILITTSGLMNVEFNSKDACFAAHREIQSQAAGVMEFVSACVPKDSVPLASFSRDSANDLMVLFSPMVRSNFIHDGQRSCQCDNRSGE